MKRIQDFLSHDELDPNAIDRKNTAQGRVKQRLMFAFAHAGNLKKPVEKEKPYNHYLLS